MRITIDFDPKLSILDSQEIVGEHPDRHSSSPLPSGIEVKWFHPGTNRKISPPNGAVYGIHPQILVLDVQLSLTLFDRCWYSLMLPLLS